MSDEEILIKRSHLVTLVEQMDIMRKELNEMTPAYYNLQQSSIELQDKYEEEYSKNKQLKLQVQSLTASLQISEATCQSFKEQYEKAIENNKANKVGLLNYMKSNGEKLKRLQEELNVYHQMFDKFYKLKSNLDEFFPSLHKIINDAQERRLFTEQISQSVYISQSTVTKPTNDTETLSRSAM